MKKTLLTAALFAIVAGASAQNKMVVEKQDGNTATEAKLADIRKLTFTDGKLHTFLKSGEETTAIPLADISKLYFVELQEGITQATETGRKGVVYDGKTISLPEIKQPVNLTLYRADGAIVSSRKSWDGQRFDISTLPQGTYILKAGNIAVKFVK